MTNMYRDSHEKLRSRRMPTKHLPFFNWGNSLFTGIWYESSLAIRDRNLFIMYFDNN